ncbi:UNVERIFIED_CONTAM: hypothetical protein GTU68_008531 [Idotea baltica]|nr:hypothetical protein [Idotea baltica]
MDFVAASPTPLHCVAETIRRLDVAKFKATNPTAGTNAAGYQARAGSLIAWRTNKKAGPVRVVTAHTDSPNLRIKPRPDGVSAGARQLGVEVYGGVLTNSWLDRDLGIAGRKQSNQVVSHLIKIDRPVLRIPQLAIHLDREINTKGLKLNKQTHLKPMWGFAGDDDEQRCLTDLLANHLDIVADDILSFDLMTHDVVPPAIGGWHDEWIASPRIDNQLSCWAAVEALIDSDAPGTQVVALFDHEEVGSTSATGADSAMLGNVLDALTAGADANSLCISADCAHATHPNYSDRHEPDHQIALNGGPVIKVNANQRYATTAMGHALFAQACDQAEVPHQVFVTRTDMACGSTVGPVTAARTGLDTVDVGAPQLAMHSIREMTGSADPGMFKAALTAALAG